MARQAGGDPGGGECEEEPQSGQQAGEDQHQETQREETTLSVGVRRLLVLSADL